MNDVKISRFTKRPVTIEAVQLTEDADWEAIAAWCGGRIHQTQDPSDEYVSSLTIPTLEGTMWVSVGDWIIRGVQGEHYPCKPDIFEATYEPAAPASLVKCAECTAGGLVPADGCTCVGGGDWPHETHCGWEPCPNGCWERLNPPTSEPASTERSGDR